MIAAAPEDSARPSPSEIAETGPPAAVTLMVASVSSPTESCLPAALVEIATWREALALGGVAPRTRLIVAVALQWVTTFQPRGLAW